jgi:WD40 repeat protein
VDGRKIDGRFQAFSPNGKRVAYTIKGEGYSDRILISNGILKSKSRQYSGSVHSVTFSPNGERVAYAVQEQDNSFVVLDDVEGKHYKGRGVVEDTIRVWPVGKGPRDSGSTDESIVENSLTFSPDGKRLAYVVSHGRGNFLVLDGQERREHNYHWYSSVLSRPVFSPDSRRVAYLAQDLETNEYYVVPDGHSGKRYTYIKYGSLQFSPDSRRFAYVVENDEAFVVVDEIEGAEYGVCSRAVFDDSNRLHYLTREGREIYLVEETWKIVTERDYTLDNINNNSLIVTKRGGEGQVLRCNILEFA